MSFLVMQNFRGLTLFIWLLSILTLSISDEIKTDGSTSLTSALNTSFIDESSKSEHQTLSSLIRFISDTVNSTKILDKNIATPSVAGEGGPISIISTIPRTSTTSHSTLDIHGNLLKEEGNVSYIKRRKNTSKIVSRKGANEMLDIKSENIPFTDITLLNDTKAAVEFSTVSNVIYNTKKVYKTYDLKSNITDKQINNASNIIVNTTLYPMNITQKELSISAPISTSLVQEHKPKPTATIIGPNSDKEGFIPHTKGSHLGIPQKIDYVLPVIITLIALPLLGAIVFMVYKQGRDCWDKRHYRRMDFLIDGMYND